MAKFLSILDGAWLDDDVRYRIGDPLIYQSDILAALPLPPPFRGVTLVAPGGILTAPSGFVTDFASVPRVPIVYELFGDRAHHESVPHDLLYQTNLYNKAICDRVFREAMISRGKPWYVVQGMYAGVVLGGRSSYNSGPARYLVLNSPTEA